MKKEIIFLIAVLLIISAPFTYAKPGGVLWTIKTGNGVYSSPCVWDGKIYFGSDDKKLYCADAVTGKTLWTIETVDKVNSSPCVWDGKVYFGGYRYGKDNTLYCADALTGKMLWTIKTGGQVDSSPCVWDGKVYFGSGDYNLYCADAETGKTLWKIYTGDRVDSSPCVWDGKVYFGSRDYNLYCADALTGKMLWTIKTWGQVDSSPCVWDGKIYLGIENGLYCADALTGKEIGKFFTGSYNHSSPCVWDGKVYIGGGGYDKKLYCMDAISGKTLWMIQTGDRVDSSPCVWDGKVYFGSGDGKLYCADAETGKTLWTLSAVNGVYSSPCVWDGKLYFGGGNNKLYCVDTGSKEKGVAYSSISGMDSMEPEKPKLPPYLTMDAVVELTSGKLLKALDSGKLVLTVKNTGKGDAMGLKVSLKNIEGEEGISVVFPKPFSVRVGETKTIEIQFTADQTLKTGYFEFDVKIDEPNFGKNTAPVAMKIQTQELYKPQLILYDWAIDDDMNGNSMGNGNKTIEAGEDIEFTIRIGNQGAGVAKDVKADVIVSGNQYIKNIGGSSYSFGDIQPGMAKDIVVPISIGSEVGNQKGAIKLAIKDALGLSVITPSIEFQIGQSKQEIKQFVYEKGKIEPQKDVAITADKLNVDVDVNIPSGKSPYKSAVAVVIGNSSYTKVSKVDYAVNDAKIMQEYMKKMFGVQDTGIIYKENAGLSDMIGIFGKEGSYLKSDLYARCMKLKPEVVYIYFSGHGMPGLTDKKGYLAPVDITANNAEDTGYSIDLLYENLGKLKEIGVKKIVVILDACFSGSDSKGQLLIKNVSPILPTVNNPLVANDIGIVLTATSGDSVATWYPEMKHGAFTYYLLKGLSGEADSGKKDGVITLDELRTYLTKTVYEHSISVQSPKAQTPEIKGKEGEIIITLLNNQ